MYTNIRKDHMKDLKKIGTIWEVVNDNGTISLVEKDAYTCKDKFCEGFIFVDKIETDPFFSDMKRCEGFTKDTFCENLDLRMDDSFHTGFRHLDKEKVKEEWNRQVKALEISKDIPKYLYNVKLNDFSEFLDFIKKNVKVSFDKICIKTRKDNICIYIYVDDEPNFEEIEFYLEEDNAPTVLAYVDDDSWDWDEGIDGTISLENFNKYIRDYGGIDLTGTYLSSSEMKSDEELEEMEDSFNESSSIVERDFLMLNAFFSGDMYNTKDFYLLPLLKDTTKRYLYELIGKNIFAYEILSEDESSWETIEGTYPKYNIKETPKFNPTCFDKMYTDNLDELINSFNENLEKFCI